MRMREVVGAALAAGALVLGAASPAAASDDGATLISLNGVDYSSAPDGAVFPAGLVLVPGSRHTGTFWVRNDSDRAADLLIAVSDTTASNAAFIEHLTLQALTPRTTDSEPVPLQHGATCTPLLEGELMQPRSVTKVSITLAMREAMDNSHQGQTADTTLMVSLSEPGAPSTAANCTSGGGIPLTPDPKRPNDPADQAGTRDTPQSGGTGHTDAPHDGATMAPSVGSGGEDGAGTAAPTDAPPGAAAPPSLGTGSPVLFPWMAVGVAVLAGGIVFGLRQRKGNRE